VRFGGGYSIILRWKIAGKPRSPMARLAS
jgi:hypothetical protein